MTLRKTNATSFLGPIFGALPLFGQELNDDTLSAEAQRTIALLHEHRTDLILAAVSGKIKVRGYANSSAMEVI
jgi:hypothetical protein